MSSDGINWYGLGATTFTTQCNDIAYNGTVWVAVGNSTAGSLSYSYDGLNWTAGASGNGTIISATLVGQRVKWNGKMFVATFNGNIYSSYDGVFWPYSATYGSNLVALEWNGNYWMAADATNTTVTVSYDGIFWSTNSTFSNKPAALLWSGSSLLSYGTVNNSVSYNATSLLTTATLSTVTVPGLGFNVKTLAYNGKVFVAGGVSTGGATLAYSYDAINWTSLGTSIFATNCYQIKWILNKFYAMGNTGILAYSYDGVNWTSNSVLSTSPLSAVLRSKEQIRDDTRFDSQTV
jgi:hypothetical protein